MMTDYSGLFRTLEEDIKKLEANFISGHLTLPAGTPPDVYDLDVRAFCVLSHAAFEQFVEDLCLGLAKDAAEAWKTNKHCSQPLLGLMVFHNTREKIEEDESKPATAFFDYIREASDKVGREFAEYLKERNNGVSEKYIRKMLTPVGLNIPSEAKWLGSLKQLASQRGDNAHKSSAKRIPSPQDAHDWVRDCMEMWANLRDQAKCALSRPQFVEDYRNAVI